MLCCILGRSLASLLYQLNYRQVILQDQSSCRPALKRAAEQMSGKGCTSSNESHEQPASVRSNKTTQAVKSRYCKTNRDMSRLTRATLLNFITWLSTLLDCHKVVSGSQHAIVGELLNVGYWGVCLIRREMEVTKSAE